MKKIVNGRVYNTETAQEICGYQYSNPSDFNYCREALYKTKKGAYFICGEGGPRSKYGHSVEPNCVSGGEGIRVLAEDEAREFTEKHGTVDDYVAAFGEPEEA